MTARGAGRAPVGFYLHPDAALHDTGWDHPEHQGRLRTLASTVGKDLLALHGHVEQLEAEAAPLAWLERVHTPEALRQLREASSRAEAGDEVVQVGLETFVSGGSWRALVGSAGAACRAAEAVADGDLSAAFVATRPPGHHADASRPMGFCMVNHVVVAARHLQATGRARRIAIVDLDVHHGNGTQALTEADPDLFYLSLHQSPWFPGTGAATETGRRAGKGTVLNVPLPAGTGPQRWHAALDDALSRAAEAFAPDLVLVSAGYDGLADDPLGGFELQVEDFHRATRRVLEWARVGAGGRVVALLEGGYAPKPTGRAVVATLRALAGLPLEGEAPAPSTGSDPS